MRNWRLATISASCSIRQAMETIDRASLQIALVIDSAERLLGTVTDGDIRRGLLRGADLSSSVDSVMNAKPLTAPQGISRVELLELLRRHDVRHLPLVDDTG